jgi:hypothetical protein
MDDEPTEAVDATELSAEEAEATPAPLIQAKPVDPFAGFYQANASIVEGQWGGHTTYQCSACPFDSLERPKTEAHLSIHGQTFTQGARP